MNEVLWKPSEKNANDSQMNKFLEFCEKKLDRKFPDYSSFHRFSVESSVDFWTQLFEFFQLRYTGDLQMEDPAGQWTDYPWFPHVELNFAENLLLKGEDDHFAVEWIHESGDELKLTYAQLKAQVASLQDSLKDHLAAGDVFAAYMPNCPQTIVGMLAATGLGAVFTSTSCDFGLSGVLDRFEQSQPKVLLAALGHTYAGKYHSHLEKISQICQRIPSIQKVIYVDLFAKELVSESWDSFDSLTQKEGCSLKFIQRNFQDPLYIMYSSGTTGKPKCIVHSVGGTLLQHVKELGLHCDLKKEEKIFYFTTCGWMMWNWLVSSLTFGSTVVLYEGSPGYPSVVDFWKKLNKRGIHLFGTSPKFLKALELESHEKKISLKNDYPQLRCLLSTGAPLLPEQFDFVYQEIKEDMQLASICGGTDILGCFMLGNPFLPVIRGEIQGLGLGMDVACFNEKGEELRGQEGELVCKRPFPSQPIGLLGDQNHQLFKKAYFNHFPGVWYHGDFILLTQRNSVQVMGRSDSTLNPGGVRIGTAEIYGQTEQLDFLADSLCVGKNIKGEVEVWLFVKMQEGHDLTPEKIALIKQKIKLGTTPRHVPQVIKAVSDIPYTRSGKKMEMAVTHLINGRPLNNLEAVANPECLDEFR